MFEDVDEYFIIELKKEEEDMSLNALSTYLLAYLAGPAVTAARLSIIRRFSPYQARWRIG